MTDWLSSQSQSDNTTGGLPPISSSWLKPFVTHDQRSVVSLSPCCNSPYVTSCPTRRCVCLSWTSLALRQVYVSHIEHVIENSSLCTIYKSSVSTGFAKQIISVLPILCYNSSLVTWTVVSLTSAKFKPLIFQWLSTRLVPSLYNLGTDRIENTASKSSYIRCCGNVFMESLPSNGSLRQSSCHGIFLTLDGSQQCLSGGTSMVYDVAEMYERQARVLCLRAFVSLSNLACKLCGKVPFHLGLLALLLLLTLLKSCVYTI
jgi:hypothetical protein